MDAYLSPYQLTAAGSPILNQDEVELQRESNLSIYFGDVKKFRKGKCILTTQRILWTDNKNIRHAIHLKHIKSTKSKKGGIVGSPKILFNLNHREVVQRINNNNNNKYNNLQQPKIIKVAPPSPGYMMLSFHTSGRDTFLIKLNKSLKSKSWIKLVKQQPKRQFNTQSAGIRGLIAENKRKQAQTKNMVTSAFADLESLMIHAKAMVALASKLSASTDAKDNASEFDKMLHGMGIISPVTKSVAGSEYHTLLARQLVDFLLKPLKRCGGMMTLTDIYCFYNKARGTQLVSPDDLYQACTLMKSMNMPMYLKKFNKTGVFVLQLNEFNEENQTKKILHLIKNKCNNQGIDELRLSQLLNISINLARQQLINAEQKDYLCRDNSNEGLKFYKNMFINYNQNKQIYWKNIKKLNTNINNITIATTTATTTNTNTNTNTNNNNNTKYKKKQVVVMDL